MAFKLRSIPDSIEEFTGFYKGRDLLGGDLLGYGSMNYFHANGTAKVRNIELPAPWRHGAVPDTKHGVRDRAIVERINAYVPPPEDVIHIPATKENMRHETRNLAFSQPARVASMVARQQKIRDDLLSRKFATAKLEGEELRQHEEALKSLGYIK